MARRTRVRFLVSCACYAGLAAFATFASGIPVVERGAFWVKAAQYEEVGVPSTPSLVAFQASSRVGNARVTVVPTSGPERPLGIVQASNSLILEAPFARFRIYGYGMDASGSYELRSHENADLDKDRLIGSGEFKLSASPYTPYGAYLDSGLPGEQRRLLVLDATGQPLSTTISVNSEPAAPTAYTVDGGDWGFCSRSISKFKVSSNVATSIPLSVYALTPEGMAVEGIASQQSDADADDGISLDGSVDLKIVLKNVGTAMVSVEYAPVPPGEVSPVQVDPGASKGFSGTLSQFRWLYSDLAGGRVRLSIGGNSPGAPPTPKPTPGVPPCPVVEPAGK